MKVYWQGRAINKIAHSSLDILFSVRLLLLELELVEGSLGNDGTELGVGGSETLRDGSVDLGLLLLVDARGDEEDDSS